MLFKNTPYTLLDIPQNSQQTVTELVSTSPTIDAATSKKLTKRDFFELVKVLKNNEMVLRRTLKTTQCQIADLDREFDALKETVCINVMKYKSGRISELLMEDTNEKEVCACGSSDDSNLIACEGSDCEIEWFHQRCVGFDSTPSEEWYCDKCAEKRRK